MKLSNGNVVTANGNGSATGVECGAQARCSGEGIKEYYAGMYVRVRGLPREKERGGNAVSRCAF